MELARAKGIPLALVGGAVRDALLGRPARDADLVVEGDGIAFARALSRKLGVSVRAHPRFGTASLTLADGSRLDVAGARAETYERPGALPRVRPGRLADDLARRDFSVNAIAARLAPGPVRLVDPHGGRADLAARRLRFLHAGSPRDDPTRAFRAALYANRLGFVVVPEALRAVAAAIRAGDFDRVSGDRIRRELARLFSEGSLPGALEQIRRLGLSAVLSPGLRANAAARSRLERLERLRGASPEADAWLAALLVWAAGLSPAEAGALAGRLNLARGPARALARWPETARALRRRGSGAVRRSPAERLAARALSPPRAPAGDDVGVRGRDLVAAGIPPGPAIGRALARTRAARATGVIEAGEELAFALARAREEVG